MPQELTERIDPLSDSFRYLLVLSFAKSSSSSYPLALSVAQGAAKYAETTVGRQLVHLAAFSRDREGAAKALAVMKYLSGVRSLQIFCNGTTTRSAYAVSGVLECYLKACSCADHAAHCCKVIDDPFLNRSATPGLSYSISLNLSTEPGSTPKARTVQRYLFPCSYVLPRFRYQHGHPSSIQDQIQAAAIDAECQWCPNFQPDRFQKLPTVVVFEDGREVVHEQ